MKLKTFIGNILIAVLSAFLAIIVYTNYFQDELKQQPELKNQNSNNLSLMEDSNQVSYPKRNVVLTGEMLNFTDAAEKSIHAVVHVTSKYNLENSDYYSNPLYEFLFGEGYKRQPSVSFGSGVIISEDGYIVTNNHVIEKSDEIQVILNDKRSYTAKLVGADPSTDLALLKIEDRNLPFIPFGNSDQLKIGEWVLAVGNPFNLTSTVTAGIVSAKARSINILQDQYSIESFIQTDAAVNQGNSGGALVNLAGELVGINSAILSPSGSYSGYSFAIPISIAKKVVADIIKYGEVQRAVLGVTIRPVTSDDIEKLKLDKIEGVKVTELSDDGAAKAAGIKVGDVIVEINNVKVNSNAQLTEQIGRYRPGEIIYLTIKRDNKKKQFDVELRNRQGNTKIVKSDEYFKILGASFADLDSRDKRRLGIEGGVKIIGLKDGALKKKGVRDDFIITHVQGNRIENVDDFKDALRKEGVGAEIEINGIYPGLRYIYVYMIELKE